MKANEVHHRHFGGTGSAALRVIGRHPAFAIGLLALALRCIVLAISWQSDGLSNMVTDSHRYMDLANTLATEGRFGRVMPTGDYNPEYLTLPAFPCFLAAFRRLGSNSLLLSLVTQCVLTAFVAAGAYVIGERTFGRRVGVVAGLLLAFDVQSVAYSNLVLTDALSMVFVFVALAGVLHYLERRSVVSACVCGLATGLAVFIRPVNVFLPLIVAAAAIVVSLQNHRYRSLAHVPVILIIAFSPVCAWTARNYAASGVWFYTATPDLVLVVNQAARVYGEVHGVSVEQARRDIAARLGAEDLWLRLADRPDAVFRSRARTLAIEIITSHPGTFLRLYVQGLVRVAVQPDEHLCQLLGQPTTLLGLRKNEIGVADAFRERWGQLSWLGRFVYFGQFPYLAVIWLLAAIGGWSGVVQGRTRISTVVLILVVACFLFGCGGYPGDPRYRLPSVPLLMMLAGLGARAVAAWLDRFKYQT